MNPDARHNEEGALNPRPRGDGGSVNDPGTVLRKIVRDVETRAALGDDAYDVPDMKLPAYRAAVADLLLEAELLPTRLLEARLADITDAPQQKVDARFEPGNTLYLVVVPVNSAGQVLTPQQVANGEHLYALVESADGRTVGGFSGTPSTLAKKFPPEVRALGFTIHAKKEDLAAAYREAFMGLRELLA